MEEAVSQALSAVRSLFQRAGNSPTRLAQAACDVCIDCGWAGAARLRWSPSFAGTLSGAGEPCEPASAGVVPESEWASAWEVGSGPKGAYSLQLAAAQAHADGRVGVVALAAGLDLFLDAWQRNQALQVALHRAEKDRARLAVQLRELADEARYNLQRLSELGRQVTASPDPAAIVSTLGAGLSTLMPADGLRVLVLDDDERLHPVGESPRAPTRDCDLDGDRDSGGDAHLGELKQCMDRPGAVTLLHGEHPAARQHAPEGTRWSALVAPLMSRKGPMGLLVVYARAPGVQTETQRAMLETLALHVGSAISNARAHGQLKIVQEQLAEREKSAALGSLADRRRNFDLAQAVGELVATMHNQLQFQHHELSVEIPHGIVMDGYPGALVHVLTNLMQNAIQHGLAGRTHGCISIVASRQRRDEVHIEFSDNGQGIAEAHLNRVFEPFFTTRLAKGGTGPGLSISHNIVTAVLGGSIHVSSPPGSGARFRMVLPLVAPGEQPPADHAGGTDPR